MTHQAHTTWEDLYAQWGWLKAHHLGQGMEGTVHRLRPGLVAKAWHHRTEEDLERLRAFYEELAAQDLPFATPRITLVRHHRGTAISVENELPGTSLDALEHGTATTRTAQEATTTVLKALKGTRAGEATRALPVLDESTPLWAGHTGWPQTLDALVGRRAQRFHGPLSAAVPDLDAVTERVLSLLGRLAGSPVGIVHGDLCPGNILVDAQGEPTAVLDWGFLTCAGDAAFDAATAAGFFDMYGPRAREFDDALVGRWVGELGYERERLLLYRAAYAIAGANSYSESGDDGHFAWCVAALRRSDVRGALGLGEQGTPGGMC